MEHFYQSIFGWSHYLEPWYKYIVPTLPDNPEVVEVGCWHGRSTACLAVELINHHDQFRLWAVDHWLGCNEPYYNINATKDEIADNQPYKIFLENMQPVKNHIKIIRDISTRAAAQFEDNSLDLVILDDDHMYESVVNSIAAWWPKVKTNGIICGDDHDVHYPGVINGVRHMFGTDSDSYGIYTYLGIADITGTGVWLVRKTLDQKLNNESLPEDFWQYKIPYKTQQDINDPVEEVFIEPETQEEQKIPTSALQNPKIRSII